RYPRGAAFGVEVQPDPKPLPYGKGEIVQEGEKVAILALGSRLHAACDAADEVHMRLGFMPLVFDPIWIKPLPEEQIADIFRRFDKILTVEESSLAGGFGSAVLEYASDHGLLAGKTVKRLGVPDRFIEHASQAQQRHELGLDVEGIYRAVEELAGGTETA
ncbi:1-deoxy-D-xylulose-5-phosphate synthase, partial [bacterium]|nr:1-deoxy-D-xylulose-5-phosphate synthase [bacterium]